MSSDEQDLTKTVTSVITADDQSQIERLRRKRREQSEAPEAMTELEIPGYDGELWVRVKVVDWIELKKIGRKVSKEPEQYRELMAQMDTLIKACVGILLRRSDGTLHPPMGQEMGFDDRLVELLDLRSADGKAPSSARAVVRALFPSDVAISALAAELNTWMPQAERQLDEDAQGN